MFCSKCGKDCGEFPFCPYCGTQVSQAEEAPALWSVGMPCPHCGGVELEGDKCAFCGAVLKKNIVTGYNKIPFGAYGSYGSFLSLDETGAIIRNDRNQEVRFTYDQICSIGLRRGLVWSWLSFRWTGNAHLPLPKRFMQAIADRTTVFYSVEEENAIQSVFYALKEVVEKNNGTAYVL